MRLAIREVQRQVGITTVYVTHDQEEALAISDRIAVMNQGVIQQVEKPYVLYSRPANVFVSTFIGHSNLFYGGREGSRLRFLNGYEVEMGDRLLEGAKGGVIVGVRPEEFVPASEGLDCKVKTVTYLGRYVNYELEVLKELACPDQSIEFSQEISTAGRILEAGEPLKLAVRSEKINVFSEDGKSLMKGVRQYE